MLNLRALQAPPVGLEPTTLRLTAACSTDWAKEEYFRYKETHLFRCFLLCTFKTTYKFTFLSSCFFLSTIPWLCPRPISNSQLHALLHFHLCPIYLVVFKGSYYLRMGYLILRGASRLDAFSVYPFPAWLPCHALGSATGTPAAGPSRSSRTKDSSSQISYAHAG